jgi:hypothetical protein
VTSATIAAQAAPPRDTVTPTSPSPLWQFLLLLALLVVVAAMRVHTYAEPLERDLGTYAWMGHLWFQGRPLYTDLIEIKPPLPFLLYGVVELVTGLGQAQAYVLGVLASWTTLLGLFWLGARGLRRPWLGLTAALFWVLLGSDLYLQANQPNTEVFINAFMVCGLALLWRLPADRLRLGACVSIGVLFACATLCKTVAFAPVAALLAAKCIFTGSGARGRVCAQAALVLGAIVLTWGAVLALLAVQGSLDSALQILFVYPREYAQLSGGSITTNLLVGFEWAQLLPDFFTAQGWLAALCIVVLLAQLLGAARARAGVMLAWACGTFVAVALPGHFFPHYYQLWLPWLAFALALVVEQASHLTRSAGGKTQALLVVACTAAWCVIWLWPQYRQSAFEWSATKYGSQFIDAGTLGQELRNRLRSDQRLFVYGVFPNIYTAAGREPFSGIVSLWMILPQIGGSLSGPLAQRLVGELGHTPPDIVVIDAQTWALSEPGQPVRDWIASHYWIERDDGRFAIAVLNGARP